MKELFKDIIGMEGVQGVVVLTTEGEIQFHHTTADLKNPEEKEWGFFVESVKNVKEAEFIFQAVRLYLRRSESHFILVIADLISSMAMLRLNCDILLPSLQERIKTKGIRGFFKK